MRLRTNALTLLIVLGCSVWWSIEFCADQRRQSRSVVGYVFDKEREVPIYGAVISPPSRPELVVAETGVDGRFVAAAKDLGYPVALVRARGYADAEWRFMDLPGWSALASRSWFSGLHPPVGRVGLSRLPPRASQAPLPTRGIDVQKERFRWATIYLVAFIALWLVVAPLIRAMRTRTPILRDAESADVGTANKAEADIIGAPNRMQPSIFICYRRSDSEEVAGRIYERLAEQFSEDAVFKDVDSIAVGRDFRKVIAEWLARCHVALVVIGPAWLSVDTDGKRRIDDPEDHVRIEIETALKREIRVIPVLVRHARMPSASDLPASISDLAFRHAAQVRPDPDSRGDMRRLISGIRDVPAPER